MSKSDFPRDSDLTPGEKAPRAEPPRIVNLPSSFDMDEFPSEVIERAGPQGGAVEEAAAATVIEFPAHAPEPPTPPLHTVVRAVTLSDLLDERGGMDWRESVALVRNLCALLKRRSQRLPILLEARNIEVTPAGELSLLSEQFGGDPLVVQIGRLLRAMLMGRPSPPELRLLLAQATFELPIFESVDEIDKALGQIELVDDPKSSAPEIVPFTPALLARSPSNGGGGSGKPESAARTIKPPAQPRRVRTRIPKLDLLFAEYGARMVAGLAAVIAAVALFIAGPSLVMPQEAPAAAANRSSVIVREPAATSGITADARLPTASVPSAAAPVVEPPAAPPVTDIASMTPKVERPASRSDQRGRNTPEPRRAILLPPINRRLDAPVPAPVPRDSERRATALIAQGQPAEAAIVFDSLLLANPLYEPKTSDLTPESLTAFRNSQNLLLPVLAQRGFDRAKAALAAGDVERALAAARETSDILERPAAEPVLHLRDGVQRILDEAGAAKAAADEIVYTKADAGVVPPRAISRQFPATTPSGVPAHRVGTLEMIVGKEGNVEFVKLHTPLNRYHERMIVSAAKAWIYRPATKGGSPVRFRLTVTINLPENGTY